MATLLLSTVGSAVGSALGGPIGGAIGRVLGAAAGALVDRALVDRDSPRLVEGPRLNELDGLASTEGAAIPRVYGRARIGGQLIWATRFEEVATRRSSARAAWRQERRRQRQDRAHHLCLLRQPRDRPVRGPDRLRAAGVGGRARARPDHAGDARPSRRRDAAAGPAHRREGGRRQRARLSRPRLCGLRAPAAGELRQPRAAILLRGGAPGRRLGRDDPRRVPDPGRDRVRLRDLARHASLRLRRDAAREPASADGRRRRGRVARRAAGAVPEPQARVARRELVRRRSARRPLHGRAARRERRQGDAGRRVVGRGTRRGRARASSRRRAAAAAYGGTPVGRQRGAADPAPEGRAASKWSCIPS